MGGEQERHGRELNTTFIPVLEKERPLVRRRSGRGRIPKRNFDESPASSKTFGDGSTPSSRANMSLLAELMLASAGHSRDPAATYVVNVKSRLVERSYGNSSK